MSFLHLCSIMLGNLLSLMRDGKLNIEHFTTTIQLHRLQISTKIGQDY